MGRPRKNPLAPVSQAVPKKINSLPGSFDVNTETDFYWEILLKRFSKMARVYGFNRVEMPLVEDNRLFEAFFADSSHSGFSGAELLNPEQKVALRPSQLPAILRFYSQAKLYDNPSLHKWHYSGYTIKTGKEGELNNDYEFGCEILGNTTHLTEAQAIASAWEFLSSLGFEELVLELNNLGEAECQQNFGRALADSLLPKKYELCDSCNDLLAVRPLFALRCQNLDCQAVFAESAPTILDFLDQASHKSFTSMLEALDEMNIPYQLNSFYVGALSTQKTNFAIKCKIKDSMKTLVEGGHHAALAQKISGKNFCAFGFQGSLFALRELMQQQQIETEKEQRSEVCLVPLGDLAAKRSLRLFRDLTAQKILVYDHFGLSGVKNQLKVAQEHRVPIALIMGQKEAMDEMVILRDVKSGMQEIISYDKIVEEVKKRLGK